MFRVAITLTEAAPVRVYKVDPAWAREQSGNREPRLS